MGAACSSVDAQHVQHGIEDVQSEQGAANAIADCKKGAAKRYMSSEELVEALAAMSDPPVGDLAPEGRTEGKRQCRATIHTELIETILLMEDDDDDEEEADQSEEEEEEKELKRSRGRKGTGFVTREQALAATRLVNFADDEADDAVAIKEPRKRCRRGTGFVTKEQAAAARSSLPFEEADAGVATKRVDFEIEEEDDDTEDLKERTTKNRRGTAFVTKKEAAKIASDDGDDEEGEDDDDDDAKERSSKGRRSTAFVSKEEAATATRQVTFEEKDDEEEDQDDEQKDARRPRSRSRRGTGFVTKEEAAAATRKVGFRVGDEDEEEKPRSTKGRRGTAFVSVAQVAAAEKKLRSSGSALSLGGAEEEEASKPAGVRAGARKSTGFVTKQQLLELLQEDSEQPEGQAKPLKKASLQKALSVLQDMREANHELEGTQEQQVELAKGAAASAPALARNAAAAAATAAGISASPPTRSVETVKQGCGCRPPFFLKVFGKPR
jgi:hypothetical protein